LPNGDNYVGDFKENKQHGQGTQYRADGTILQSGIYENNVFVRGGAAPRVSLERSDTPRNGSRNGGGSNDIAPRAIPTPNDSGLHRDPKYENSSPRYESLSAVTALGSVAEVLDWLSKGYNIEGESGEPPIVTAARYQRHEIVALLLQKGARVDHPDQQGRSAMFYAKLNADAPMIELLTKAGARNPFQ
jgi:ankyrin repeat protein